MVSVFFIIFLIIRPLLDSYTSVKILGGVNPAGAITSLLAILCGMSLLFRVKRILQHKVLQTFNFFFLLFFIASIVSLINSNNPTASLSEIIRYLILVIFFNYVAITFRNEKGFQVIFLCTIFSSLVPLAAGLYQIIFRCGNLATFGFNRIQGTFVHPNVHGQYLLLIALLILFYLSTYAIDKWKRYGLVLLFSLVLLEIYYTFTRSVWIALVAGFIVFIFIRNRQIQKIRYGAIFTGTIGLVLPFAAERWLDLFGKNKHIPISSWEWRTSLWKSMIEKVQEHPFIGHGYGMFDYNVGFGAHNDYLRILYETGFLGLTMYLLLLVFFVFFAVRGIMGMRLCCEYNKYKLILGLMLTIFLISYGDNLLRNTVVMFYYFCTIAFFLNFPEPQQSGCTHEQNTLS
jgi:O-antigen ligase